MRLTDCFINIIAYMSYFLKTVNERQPAYDRVRTDIQDLITQSESCLENEKISREDYDLARFAVFAWVDEAIMASPWNGKTHWQREKLQRIYYQTEDAGEIFFKKLDPDVIGFHQREVREVYCLCLFMGFSGQYCKPGDEFLLEQVKKRNLKIVFGSSVGIPSLEDRELFPQAYQEKDVDPLPDPGPRFFSPVTLISIGLPVVIYWILYFWSSFDLKKIGEKIIGMVP